MSWIDRIKTDLSISLGDGNVFTPQYVISSVSKNVQYNISEFFFKGVKGSLVKRGTNRGTQYDMNIKFVGEDNIEVAAAFQKSSENPKPWTISHPFYDNLFVQPVSLTFDNSVLNVTTINAVIIETILNSGATPDIVNAQSKVVIDAVVVDEVVASALVAEVPAPDPSFLQKLTENILKFYQKVVAKLNSIESNLADYTAEFNKYNSILNAAVLKTTALIAQAQRIAAFPANFIATVRDRIELFKTQLEVMAGNIANILSIYSLPTAQLKRLYEANAGACISGMCVAAVTNITDDYDYRPNVLQVIKDIVDSHNAYLANLDLIQTANGGGVDSYIPDPNGITLLTFLVNYTVSALFDISAGAKQERVIYLQEVSNVILMTYELYGMSVDDSTIDTFMTTNNIDLKEVLLLEKGRKITYYV